MFDANHPTCKSCPVGCALKTKTPDSKPSNRPAETSLRQGVGDCIKSQKQTKAEIEAGNMLQMEFPGCHVVPWGLKIRMLNGHVYTPDFVVWPVEGKILVVEVKQRGKSGFRQNSYQRAKLAFDQCKVEYDLFLYRWMEKQNGEWEITGYGGR